MSENTLSRAIMLGLALLSGGAHAAGPTPPAPPPEPFDPADLAGLVALDGEPAGDSGPGEVQEGDPAGTCPGPSGCVADLILSTVVAGATQQLPRSAWAAVALIQNNGLSGMAADNVQLTLETTYGQDISGEGCTPSKGRSISCPMGSLGIGNRAAKHVLILPGENPLSNFQVTAHVSSPTPDPVPGNNGGATLEPPGAMPTLIPRITRFRTQDCPLIIADVSSNNRLGAAANGPSLGPGVLEVFDNGQWLGRPAALDPDLQSSTVIFVLDNSAAVAPETLQAHKQAIAQEAAAWHAEAASAGHPLPVFAVRGSANDQGEISFVNSPGGLSAQLSQIQQSAGPNRLYDTLIDSATVLSQRRGRVAVVAMLEAADATGSVLADPLQPLRSSAVPVYPIVSQVELEPLARSIAQASAGFRQFSRGDDAGALANVMGSIRRLSRLSWVAPSGGEPRRNVLISQNGPDYQQASGTYSQSDGPCSRPCIATRVVDPVGTPPPPRLTIVVDPNGQAMDFTVREIVPQGVYLVGTFGGGLYNAESRTVTWEGKAVVQPVQLGYSFFTLPGVASLDGGELTFSGALSTEGTLFPVCGDSTAAVLPLHPADIQGVRILPEVLEVYADTWRSGTPWVGGVSPIPLAHVTRAGQIAAAGGNYARTDAPIPWTRQNPPPLPYVLAAQRNAPAFYSPGQPVAVELQVQPHPLGVSGAVEEYVPGGWEIVSIGQDGVFDAVNRVVRWGPFADNLSRTLTYSILAPAQATDEVVLVGRYSVDGDQREFSGRTSLGNAQLDPLFADDFE